MEELIIASDNKGKINEIRALIGDVYLLSLRDIGYSKEIAEPFDSFSENAFAKASTIFEAYGKNVFADDSGICIASLNGLPGAGSAHYSGERDDLKNTDKVLADLTDIENRNAYYIAVICLIWESNTYFFEGVCNGTITRERRGTMGFGYDPIFIPDGYDHTFAELPPEIKNTISHRGIAIKKMAQFIKDQVLKE